MIRRLLPLTAAFLALGSGPVNTAGVNPPEIDGAMVPASALIALLNTLANNAAPGPGDFTFSPLPVGTILSGNQIVQGIVFSQTGAAATHTLPTAAQIISALPGGNNSAGSVVGRTFLAYLINTNTPSGAVTIQNPSGSNVTLLGTFSIAASYIRWVIGQVLTASTVQLTSLGETPMILN